MSGLPARLAVAAPTVFGMSAVVSRAPPRTAGVPPTSPHHPDTRRPRWHCAHAVGRAAATPPTHRSTSSRSNPPPRQRVSAVSGQRSLADLPRASESVCEAPAPISLDPVDTSDFKVASFAGSRKSGAVGACHFSQIEPELCTRQDFIAKLPNRFRSEGKITSIQIFRRRLERPRHSPQHLIDKGIAMPVINPSRFHLAADTLFEGV